MTPNRDTKTYAVVALLAAVLCYGCVPIFLRSFTKHLDAWCVNALRYSCAALFWLPFILVFPRRARPGRSHPGRSVWIAAIVPSAVNLIGQVGWALAPYYVTASVIGFTIRLSFLFTICFSFLWFSDERLLARKPFFIAGAAVCVLGVALMFLEGVMEMSRASLVGMAILVGSAVFWGAYAASVRRWMADYPVTRSFGVISLYTAGGLVALMLLIGDVGRLGQLRAAIWLWIIASAFVGIAFSHVLYYRGILRLGPVVASGVLMAAPFVTYLGAWLILGEGLTTLQLVGGLGVVAGGVLLVAAKAQLEAELPPDQKPGPLSAPDR